MNETCINYADSYLIYVDTPNHHNTMFWNHNYVGTL